MEIWDGYVKMERRIARAQQRTKSFDDPLPMQYLCTIQKVLPKVRTSDNFEDPQTPS